MFGLFISIHNKMILLIDNNALKLCAEQLKVFSLDK